MIQRFLPVSLLLSLVLIAGCGKQDAKATATKPAAGTPTLESVDQRVSYGIGHNLGSNLARDKVLQLDRAALEAGLADGLAQAKTRVAEADLETAFTTLQQRAQAAAAAAAEKQLAAGKAYLEQNKAKPGVKVTDSGLQYEVLKSGNGAKPKATDTVKVHYHGTLVDGTVFDSSIERNEPIEFPVGGVIKGWVEALQLMSVGDKWRLTIPADLAYGARAAGDIPANSVLVFEVELLEIKQP
jgi:FKBP-type peptidyl-prolyl cis-trans isomerase FklB